MLQNVVLSIESVMFSPNPVKWMLLIDAKDQQLEKIKRFIVQETPDFQWRFHGRIFLLRHSSDARVVVPLIESLIRRYEYSSGCRVPWIISQTAMEYSVYNTDRLYEMI